MQRAKSFFKYEETTVCVCGIYTGIYIHLTANHKGAAVAETKKISHCKRVVTTALVC